MGKAMMKVLASGLAFVVIVQGCIFVALSNPWLNGRDIHVSEAYSLAKDIAKHEESKVKSIRSIKIKDNGDIYLYASIDYDETYRRKKEEYDKEEVDEIIISSEEVTSDEIQLMRSIEKDLNKRNALTSIVVLSIKVVSFIILAVVCSSILIRECNMD